MTKAPLGKTSKGVPGWLSGLSISFGLGCDPRILGLSPASGSTKEQGTRTILTTDLLMDT